jgi:hypothetical protein
MKVQERTEDDGCNGGAKKDPCLRGCKDDDRGTRGLCYQPRSTPAGLEARVMQRRVDPKSTRQTLDTACGFNR